MKDRSFQTSVDSQQSTVRPIGAGVPQGSVLGPVLYNIFTSDFPQPESADVKMATYADDVVIFTHGINIRTMESKLSRFMKDLHSYYLSWGVRINTDKSEVLTFIGRNSCW